MGDGGVVGQVDEVAGRGQFGAPGHGVAVDLGNDWLGQVPQRQPAVGDVAGPASVTPRRVGGSVGAEV